MSQFTTQTHWKNYLPNTFEWLDKVEINFQTNFNASSGYHIVLLGESDTKTAMTVDANLLPDSVKANIIAQGTKLCLKKTSNIVPILSDDTPFLVTHPTSLEISDQQKGMQIGLDATKFFKKSPCDHITICAGDKISSLSILEGLCQGFYDLQSFKGGAASKTKYLPKKITLLEKNGSEHDVKKLIAFAQGQALSRMLGDAPANWLDPAKFAEIAEDIANELGLKCEIKAKEDIQKLGMGSFDSVSNGSAIGPRLITIEIEGEDQSETVALVGKGLTFDVGGLCLKPSSGLEEMKYDMCGGGSVLGSAYALGKVKPPKNVVCLIGAVENLVGEKATRPGDIVTAMNGKTIEVINTDAEGRLVLADVLFYAQQKWQPKLMIDVATLTGAVLVALGSSGSAIMSNKQNAANYVLKISEKLGEPLWQLPLWPELAKEIKSDVADLKNIVSPSIKAGTLAAGTFLREFVEDTPWVHIDIAGTAWSCKTTGYPSSGGSGFIVKTLAQACLSFEKL